MQLAGGGSDELAVAAAYTGWKKSLNKSQYCAQNFLASGVMNAMEGMREALQDELEARGFLEVCVPPSRRLHRFAAEKRNEQRSAALETHARARFSLAR